MLSVQMPPQSGRMVNAKSVYMLYLMLKHHMSGKYDVLKYNWRMSVSDKAFERRRDKYFFKKLSEKYNLKELVHIFVCNFISNEDAWVGDISGADALAHYRERIGKILRINNVYEDDIKSIIYLQKKMGLTLNQMFEYNDKNISVIFKMVQSQLISDETFILLDSFLNIIEKHDTISEKNNLIWNEYSVKISAYKNLLCVDKVKAKQVFVENVKLLKELNS